jgi:PAS domain S-box-containing protein
LIQIEYRVVTKDGWLIWIHDDAVVARAGDGGALHLQGYLADITARRESELELHEPQERYRALAEQLPFVTYIGEAVPEGPAQYISPQIEELLGYIPEEWLAGEGLFTSSVHPDDRVVVLERMRRYMIEGRTLEAEYRMVTRDGRVIYVRDIALPVLDAAGHTRHWQGYVLDITERRAIEEQRDRLLESEREQNERLRGARPPQGRIHRRRLARASYPAHVDPRLPRARPRRRRRDAPEHRNFLVVIERNEYGYASSSAISSSSRRSKRANSLWSGARSTSRPSSHTASRRTSRPGSRAESHSLQTAPASTRSQATRCGSPR